MSLQWNAGRLRLLLGDRVLPKENPQLPDPSLDLALRSTHKRSEPSFWDWFWDSGAGSRRAGPCGLALTCTFVGGGGIIQAHAGGPRCPHPCRSVTLHMQPLSAAAYSSVWAVRRWPEKSHSTQVPAPFPAPRTGGSLASTQWCPNRNLGRAAGLLRDGSFAALVSAPCPFEHP